MGRRGMRTRKPKGPKKVPYRLIGHDSSAGKLLYKMLHGLVKEHHRELAPANIALAWHSGWKLDVDGRQKLGMAKVVGALEKEFHEHDLLVILNRAFFEFPSTTPEQQKAILDHELSHFGRKVDTNGEEMEDERGRPVFRMVRHDLEEFSRVVERNGLYKRDIERFAQALARRPQQTLPGMEQPCEEAQTAALAPTNGNGKSDGTGQSGDVEEARKISPRHPDAQARAKAKQGLAAVN